MEVQMDRHSDTNFQGHITSTHTHTRTHTKRKMDIHTPWGRESTHTHTHTHTVHTFTYADTYTFTFTHLHTLKINRGIEQTNAQGYYTPRHNTNAQTHIRLHQMYTHTHTRHTSLCKYMQRQTVT